MRAEIALGTPMIWHGCFDPICPFLFGIFSVYLYSPFRIESRRRGHQPLCMCICTYVLGIFLSFSFALDSIGKHVQQSLRVQHHGQLAINTGEFFPYRFSHRKTWKLAEIPNTRYITRMYVRSTSTRVAYGRSGSRSCCLFAGVSTAGLLASSSGVRTFPLAGRRRQRACQEICCESRDGGRPSPRRATVALVCDVRLINCIFSVILHQIDQQYF